MAEKIYVLDAHTRYDAPGRVAEPREARVTVRRDSPGRAPIPVQHEGSPRPDKIDVVLSVDGGALDHASPLEGDLQESWVKSPQSAARRPFRPLRALAGLYSLGGVAPLALRVGPRQFSWAALSIVALTAWVTLGWFWTPVRTMMTSARLPILPFLVAMVVVHLMGAMAWTRAVLRTIRDERFRPEDMPRPLCNPWIAGAIGFLVPGFGLAVAGRATRAAFAMWNAAQVLFAGLVLSQVGVLWTWNTKSGVDALPKNFVEGLFVVCAGILVLGGLMWIATALDGARLQPAGRSRSGRFLASGDGVAVALVAALIAGVALFHPAQVASDLDAFSGWLRGAGARLVPLGLETVAANLDPGRPAYAMCVADLYSEIGQDAKAAAIHDRLRERWEAYAQMLLQQTATTRGLEPALPIQPGEDLVPRTPELGPSLAAQAAPSSTAAQ
jgi:hypothetical protein